MKINTLRLLMGIGVAVAGCILAIIAGQPNVNAITSTNASIFMSVGILIIAMAFEK